MKASDLYDLALVRLFTEARERMDLPSALRYVIARSPRVVDGTPTAVTSVAEEVARRYGVDVVDLLGHGDGKRFWIPRGLAWWVTHVEFGISFPIIAKGYAGRDHSTVVKALDRFEARFVDDVALQAEVAEVAAAVRGQLGQVRAA